MAVQYFCQNKARRVAVEEHAVINGIAFLEVLDQEAPVDSPRQQTLLVRCFKPVPALTAANVRIEGGVRIAPVSVVWAYPAPAIPAALLTTAEQTYFSSLAAADHVLVVRTDSAGDYSTYRLFLQKSPATPEPPDGFDRLLSEIDFSFKVECPGDFDCKADAICPPEMLQPPQIDYLARDYASFRRLMLDRLSAVMPEWRERSPADQWMALVEVLAYAGDHLSYFQDAAATEAYLGTARKRVSVRRHARLLDYRMHEGCNARAWVHVEIEPFADGNVLRKVGASGERTRFLSRVAASVAIAPSGLDEILARSQPEVFEPMHEQILYSSHNEILFYTWGDDQCCLPKGATRATLIDDESNRLRLRPGDVLIFEEIRGPATGLASDAGPGHRQAVRLTRVTPEAEIVINGTAQRTPGPVLHDPLTGQAIVEIEWHPQDALTFPLCISVIEDGRHFADVSVARGNVVLVDHGLTLPAEELVPDTVPERGLYRPRLQRTGLSFATSYVNAEATGRFLPAGGMLRQEARAALPSITLRSGGETWVPRQDLLNAGRFAREFVVEMEEDGRAYLRFGDNVMGRKPAPGTQFQAAYRVGNGMAGNVGAEAIAHVVTGMSGVRHVRNPLPAAGGTEKEKMEQVRHYAPQAFRTQERAVTEADYAEAAQRYPEVQKAMATLRWTGSWYTMFITVDRIGGREVDAAFEVELRQFLERFRMAGYDLEIDGPRFVPLDIAMTVCVKPGYFRGEVQQALLELFSSAGLPDGGRGFFHPDNFTFGQPVYLSQMVSAAMQVPGVQWVDTEEAPEKPNRFRRLGEVSHGEWQRGMIEMGRLEIARLDNDPSRPENGKIEFIMQGAL